MDYRGQVRNEYIYMLIFLIIGMVGFGAGLWFEDFDITFSAWLTSIVTAALACIPDWPVYNKHPIAWTGTPSVVTEVYATGEPASADARSAQQADQERALAQTRARMAAQRRAKK